MNLAIWDGLPLISAWVTNHVPSKLKQCVTVKVWEWISNFIQHYKWMIYCTLDISRSFYQYNGNDCSIARPGRRAILKQKCCYFHEIDKTGKKGYCQNDNFFWNYSQVIVTEPEKWEVHIGQGNGLVPSGLLPYSVTRPQWVQSLRNVLHWDFSLYTILCYIWQLLVSKISVVW